MALFSCSMATSHRHALRARIELQRLERRGRGPVERQLLPGDPAQRFAEPLADLAGQLVDAGQDVRARPGPGRAGEDDRLAVGIDQLGRQEILVADPPDAADEQALDALAQGDLAADGLVDPRDPLAAHPPEGLLDAARREDVDVLGLLDADGQGRLEPGVEDLLARLVVEVRDEDPVALAEGQGLGRRLEEQRLGQPGRAQHGPGHDGGGRGHPQRLEPGLGLGPPGLGEQHAQVGEGRAHRGIALVGLLGQHPGEDALEALGQALDRAGDRRGLLGQDGARRRRGRFLLERVPAAQHLVEDDAEREDVRARVEGPAPQLLRRHVGRSAGGQAFARGGGGRRHGQGGAVRGRVGVGPGEILGQSEVHDLGVALGGHHDVGGLDVAVDDALLVGRPQGLDDLGGGLEGFAGGQGPLADPVAQGPALDELHGEEELVLDLADLVDAADVGMAEGRGRLGLADEAGPDGRVRVGRLGQELEGDLAVEGGVLGQIDLAHAALAELAEDGVFAGDRPARSPLRGRGRRGGDRLRVLHGLVPGLSRAKDSKRRPRRQCLFRARTRGQSPANPRPRPI
jgi:hypothetical protein